MKWVANEAVPQWRFADHEDVVAAVLQGKKAAEEVVSHEDWQAGKAIFLLPGNSEIRGNAVALQAIGKSVEKQRIGYVMLGESNGLAVHLASLRHTEILVFKNGRGLMEALFFVPAIGSASTQRRRQEAATLAGEAAQI